MSKTKGKPKTPTTGPTTTAGAWEASLASTLVNDEELKIAVHLLSPDKVEDKLQLQLLGNSVETNVRQKFVYIEKDSLVTQGKEYGKSRESGAKTSFPEVFALLKSNDEALPASVLARLLKVKILDYRDAELAKREDIVKTKSGQNSRSPAKSVSPDKAKKDKKGGKKSPVKKGEGGNNIEPEAEIPRGKCPLKKRGEEKEEPKKIDDYPEGGPDIYVLCVGFEQADFIAECHKTNLPISSLIRSSSSEYSTDAAFLEHINLNLPPKVITSEDERGDGLMSRVAAYQEILDTFWVEVAEQARDVPLPACLVDVGFENMLLPRLVLDAEIKKDNERMEEIKLSLYEHVADKIYSLQNSYSQFLQYNKGMELIDVVDLTDKSEEGEMLYPLDMRYYNKTISLLPYESVTHISILNVILEQVCQENQENDKEVKENSEDPVNRQLGKMIQTLPLTLQQQTEFEGFMALKREKEETEEQPIVLKAGDDIGSRTFHLNTNLYPLNDRNLLAHSICNNMLELPHTSPEILAKIQSLAYETEMFCGEASHNIVNKALRQFAFENFDISAGRPGISSLKHPNEYFWDIELLMKADATGDSYSSLNKLKPVEIPEAKVKLDHYTYSTSYEKEALLQVLSEAFYENPHCERIYHRHEHAMLLLFHAGYNERRCSHAQWNERVHTDIGFHYFMSRTKEKFSNLLETLPPLTPAPVPSEVTAPPTPVTQSGEETEEEPEFQMPINRLEGFKKRSELKEENKERVPTGKKAKSKSAEKKGARKGSPSPKRKGSPAKSPKRTGSPKRSGTPSRQSSAKSDKTKVEFDPVPLAPEAEMDIVLEEEPGRNVFVGFRLPNQIFEAAGRVSHCHPADGSVLRIEKWGFDGNNPRSRISILKDGHIMSLNYHLKSEMDLKKERRQAEDRCKAAETAAQEAAAAATEGGETTTGETEADLNSETSTISIEETNTPLAKSASFNAQLKSGLCMSFKKPSKPCKTVHLECEEEREQPLSTLMTVSVPTGLVVEYCQKQEEQDYYAIRQTYEKKTTLKHQCEKVQAKACAEEQSRLYLSTGAVVKHMNNGQTVILYADGGYAIKHVAPPPPVPVSEPDSNPETTSNAATPTAAATPVPLEPAPHLVWEVTKEQGEREHVMSNEEVVQISPLQCYSATDPESKEVMFTRKDSILSVTRPDGTRIVDHTDGTRITTVTTSEDNKSYKIECVGYATLEFSESTSQTIFGTATKIIGIENRTFVIEEEGGSRLEVSPHTNNVEFSSKPLTKQTLDPKSLNSEPGQLPYSPLGLHQFKLDDEICFEHTDVAGNVFNVSYDGNVSSQLANTHVIQNLDNFYKENEVGPYHEIEERFKPPMRMFVIHADKTGTEIMDLPKCKALFDAPENDSDIVKVEEDVENDDLAKGYTFLAPFYASPGSKWVKQFDEGDIVPDGLVYDGNVRPAKQIMGGWEKRASSPIIDDPELPPAIHYHQVIEESMINDYRRELVLNGLRAHAKWMVEQELHSNKAATADGRPDYEKEAAEALASKVGTSKSTPRLPSKVHSLWRSESKQYASARELYSEDLVYNSSEEEFSDQDIMKMDRLEKRRNTVDSVTRKYSTAVSHNPFKMKMKLKKGIIPQAKWDQIMREKMEVNILKSDLRHFRVPPYFESKFGEAFLNSLKQGPDMGKLSGNVPSPIMDSSVMETIPSDKSLDAGGKGESLSTSMILIDDTENQENQGSNVSLPLLGATPRPGNPTPNVAKGSEADLKVAELKVSPKRVSPPTAEPSPRSNRNLSPHHEETETRVVTIETPDHDLLSSRQNSKPASGTVKSLHVDVKGDVRRSKVKIPRSIRGYKPGTEPNERFLAQEEPVRRGVKTSSVLAAAKRKGINEMRGFQVYPPEVSFGVLCPSGMYATTVTLKNVGIDSCRFQIKCPRNTDGVSVALHSETNFVAAGMSVKFDVCLKAAEVTEIGHVSLDIAIIMEMEVFHLPVLATVLPTQEYDERSRSGRLTRLPQHIKIIDVSSVINSSSSVYRSRGAFKVTA